MSLLPTLWFYIFLMFTAIYTILDGFDLGVGIWSFFTKDGPEYTDRRILIKSIAPFWDGNEVWLLAAGVLLFTAFADVYATIFSGFYIPILLVVFSLIFRAVAIEFRSEFQSKLWQQLCDIGITLGSFVPALSYGLVVGNVIGGIPLDASKNYTGDIFYLFNPYALLIGLLGLFMILTQGALYLMLRTSNEIEKQAWSWAKISWVIYLILFSLALIATFFFKSHLVANYQTNPFLLIFPVAGLAAILLIGYFWQRTDALKAFLSSSFSIAILILSAGIGQYPNLVRATDPLYNLTILNTSGSETSLLILLIITIFGLIFVIPYTAWVYKVFSGKIGKDQLVVN